MAEQTTNVSVAPELKGVVSAATGLPQKRFYRQRAHSNPLSDHTFNDPTKPSDADWASVYPLLEQPEHAHKQVEFLDVGCGYGGMLVELSPMFPTTLMLGIEIRVKVADYVHDRIAALQHQHPGLYQNLGLIRTNAMKFLPNYFRRGQLTKMFFLYPDPHFKKKKHKWRIMRQAGSAILGRPVLTIAYCSDNLLDEYAFVLREGGIIYTITDVVAMHECMAGALQKHPLFERLGEDELRLDPIVPKLYESTEEGKKVYRNKAAGENHGDGDVRLAIYRRLPDPSS